MDQELHGLLLWLFRAAICLFTSKVVFIQVFFLSGKTSFYREKLIKDEEQNQPLGLVQLRDIHEKPVQIWKALSFWDSQVMMWNSSLSVFLLQIIGSFYKSRSVECNKYCTKTVAWRMLYLQSDILYMKLEPKVSWKY